MTAVNINSLFSIGGTLIKFDFLSIIFLIIIVAMFFIMFIKGFLNSLVTLFATFGSVILALLITSWLVEPFSQSIFSGINTSIYNSIAEKGDIFSTLITIENHEIVLEESLSALNIPSFFAYFLSGFVVQFIPEEGIVLATLISSSITKLIAGVITYIIVWLILFIVFTILKKVTKEFNDIAIIGPINRIVGGVIGLAFAFFICVGTCFIINILMSISPSINNFFVGIMNLDQDNIWSISKAIFQLDLFGKILS